MIKCARLIEFDAAHRVIGHEHKCKYLHGHRYKLEVFATSDKLNDLGMVTDFGILKSIIKRWIDKNLDHNVILHKDDRDLGEFIDRYTGQRVYYIKNNPTAENIASHLLRDVFPSLFLEHNFNIIKVKLYETPNCFVTVSI